MAYHLPERTSGSGRVDGQYVVYMSAPALDVRYIRQWSLGETRAVVARAWMLAVFQAIWWLCSVVGRADADELVAPSASIIGGNVTAWSCWMANP